LHAKRPLPAPGKKIRRVEGGNVAASQLVVNFKKNKKKE